jgi:hypothetical protein
MPGRKWSFFENGMPGLHLTINPLRPLPPEVHVVRQYLDQGIVLNDQERASILRGRDEGVGTVKTILDQTIPGFAPDTRLKFANQIVDALLDKRVSAQLSREAPSLRKINSSRRPTSSMRSCGCQRQASSSKCPSAFPSPFTSTPFWEDGGDEQAWWPNATAKR